MHKYRQQAKFAAWYDDPDEEPPKYSIKNPFAKYRAPNSSRTNTIRDEEHAPSEGLTTVQTHPGEDGSTYQRRKDFVGKAPAHAATSPTSASNPAKFGDKNDFEIPSSSSPANSIKGIREETAEPIVEDSSGTLTNGNDEKENGLTQRPQGKEKKHGLKGMFHKKDKDESPDMDDGSGKNKPKKNFTAMSQIRATLFNSWINVLLIFSPVGIATYYAGVTPVAVFVINFIAIIPLAAMLSYATEEIALRTGEVIGGLLNATFGNAVELIVSIIALLQDQVLIVQTSLIGSMLSNLLLVMGMCFFFGGVNRLEQSFNVTVAQTASSLLFLAVSSLIIPTAFDLFASDPNNKTVDPANPKTGVVELSRGTSILLLIVYACYLFFQLKSHTKMFSEPSQKADKRNAGTKFKNAVVPSRFRERVDLDAPREDDGKTDEPEEPQLSIWVAVGTLAASTVLVALNAEYLVDSINAITCEGPISKTFVGLILLPIVGNAAEHATAVTVAVKDKMDLAIGVAVGSSMQIALLVLPLIVVLGWIIGKDDMTLFFDGFQIAILFVAVLLVNYLIQDGKSHWLEGVLLMILYVIIAVAAWFYPAEAGCEGK